MSESLSPDQISRAFKDAFAGKTGRVVLDNLGTFCMAKYNQNPACVESSNQTFYNLGAYAVYRYIQHQISMDLGNVTNDCIMGE